MAPRNVAVLDIGKTNVKLVVHNLVTGEDVFVRTRPNRVLVDGPYPHYDMDAIDTFLIEALREAAAAHSVDAVTVTTHGASTVLMAGDDLALPVLDYEHAGPDSLAAAYDAVRPPFSETASPRLAGGLNVGAQLFWLQRTFPDAFARADTIIPYPQYWAWRLCGVKAAEATSFGCHTDLWNPGARSPSSLMVRMGWDRLLPPFRSAFDALGPVRPEIAAATGLPPDTPVHCGIHDSNASLLPHLLTRTAPFTVVSTGTWVILFAVGAPMEGLDPARDTLANIDAYGRPVPGARFMGGREFDLLTDGNPVPPDADTVRAVLERQVMALPAFVSHSGPFPGRTGRWTHDPETLPPAERTAAASLYEALMTATALALCNAAGPTVVEGPFARNPLYADALARLTGRPVVRTAGSTGTSTGAALLAAPGHPVATGAEITADGSWLGPTFDTYATAWHAAAG
ncbi:FGGY-family carbohydrate kinase [Chthonobacter albigriseus]|uniref:FGGY-family carbohydrate kinase n=1 Tax=Chthonobacter albigriseus TaxID=1683161 RepID=UPI0015EEA87A|nr:FGGY-family carbohydrate kinase [Chthonobacter albigriseus]